MKELVDRYFSEFVDFKDRFEEELLEKNIGILSDFFTNKELILQFHKKYVINSRAKVVLCGLNPGRFGAGLTGIPFIDFESLSSLLPNVNRSDQESSAGFIYAVIKRFGANYFYRNVYMTNISKFGYIDTIKGRNINYPDLPIGVQNWLFDKFIDEMKVIKPKIIIPLSKDVEKTLKELFDNGKLPFELGPRINHPAWVMTYKRSEMHKWVAFYEQVLRKYIGN